jgi:hypothetical protein
MNGRNICALSLLDDPACQLLNQGAPQTPGVLHRLDKADTTDGLTSILPVVDLIVPFAMVLYERLLGRSFTDHRDSFSELVSDVVEAVIKAVLSDARVTFRKTQASRARYRV